MNNASHSDMFIKTLSGSRPLSLIPFHCVRCRKCIFIAWQEPTEHTGRSCLDAPIVRYLHLFLSLIVDMLLLTAFFSRRDKWKERRSSSNRTQICFCRLLFFHSGITWASNIFSRQHIFHFIDKVIDQVVEINNFSCNPMNSQIFNPVLTFPFLSTIVEWRN